MLKCSRHTILSKKNFILDTLSCLLMPNICPKIHVKFCTAPHQLKLYKNHSCCLCYYSELMVKKINIGLALLPYHQTPQRYNAYPSLQHNHFQQTQICNYDKHNFELNFVIPQHSRSTF